MATKVDRSDLTSAPKGADASEAAEEIAILEPDRSVGIAGEKIVVREFGFVEGLRLNVHVAPIVQGLLALMEDSEEAPPYSASVAVFAEHLDHTVALMAASCGKPVSWIEGLGSRDGDTLLMTFYATNAPFFFHRVADEAAIRREQKKLLAGASSTPSSSQQDTASSTSGDTPSGN